VQLLIVRESLCNRIVKLKRRKLLMPNTKVWCTIIYYVKANKIVMK